jgi:choline dehydrogenase-like flavoprotein
MAGSIDRSKAPEVLVIGSGPSGVAAAWGLLASGVRVRMLDGGLRLEPERAAAVGRLRDKPRKQWTSDDLKAVKGTVVASSKGVEDKLLFGSSFVFRGMDRFHPVRLAGAKMYQTLAEAGLSNVWGGSMLPATASDLDAWPFGLSELEPHYRQVLARMPYAAREDDVARVLPLYAKQTKPARLSRQATAFLADLDAHRTELAKAGWTFGQGRIAVRTEPSAAGPGCVSCGLCMYGCPWDHIWSAQHALRELEAVVGFRRETGFYVERLVESPTGVTVTSRSIETGDVSAIQADHVVLAAGVVSSTRVLLSSLEAYDRPIRIRHSEHFQFPLMRVKGVAGVAEEDLHTLCQVYLELHDERVSPKSVHLQVYTYNDLFAQVIDGMLGKAYRLFSMPASMVLGRLLLVQAYLHSDFSSHILARLAPGPEGALTLEGVANPEAERSVKRVIGKLDDHWRAFGARAVPGMTAISKPGSGNHSGGSFPMRERPGPFESDVSGRPTGFERVYVADSSVLPSIPATTVTLTVMANAHRIGQRVAAHVTGVAPESP